MNCNERKWTSNSTSKKYPSDSLVFAQYLIVNSSLRVTQGPYVLRSNERKLGFIALSTTSLTYNGSSISLQCREKKVSASLSAATSSSFLCLVSGGALIQLSVLLRLTFLIWGRPFFSGELFDTAPSPCLCTPPLSAGGDLRLPEDRECSSLWISRCANAFVGVLRA